MDLIVSGGMVADGTGTPPFAADVGIQGGLIETIGDLSRLEAPRLDASGHAIAPGFIDVHSHSDFTLLVDPRAQSQISQGVTTEVIGNCGHGCVPVTDPHLFTGNIYGYTDDRVIDWHSTAAYLERLEQAGPATNVATLVPNGNLRIAHVSDLTRPAIGDELEAMDRDLREGLEFGALGFSTGLEYPPERHAGEDEIASLCETVCEYGGIYATHTRNREVDAVGALDEALRAARRSGASLHVSHINPRRGGPADAREQMIELVDRATDAGDDVTFDTHTRLYGITNLSTAIPPDALSTDAAELAATLPDRAARTRLRQFESIISSFGLGGWENVSVFSAPRATELQGHSIADLGGTGDPWDAIFDILATYAEDIHSVLVICRSYDEAEVVDTARHPLCMVGSDATALCPVGPLGERVFLGAYSWAGWYLRRMVRETGFLQVEEAVRRLTSMAADRFGLGRRGRLERHAPADVVVFDPERVTERATLDEPNVFGDGVRHVIVNGRPALVDAEFTNTRNGRVLRRAA